MGHKLIEFDYELKQWSSTTLGYKGKIWNIKGNHFEDGEDKFIPLDIISYQVNYTEFIMLRTELFRIKLMRTEEVKDVRGI